jgi:hypothetical protein
MIRLLTLIVAIALLEACGAPAQSASDVEASLDSIDVSLESKLKLACDDLMDPEEPTIQGADIKTGDCKIDRSKVADYKTHGTMKFFEPESESVYDAGGDKTSLYRRSQLWLSHNLVELGAKGHCVLSKVDELKDALSGVGGDCDGSKSTKSSGGETDGISSGGDISNLFDIQIEPIGEPKIDLESGVVTGEVDLKVTGTVDVDAGLKYSAGGVGKNIAVVLKTVEKGSKNSLLKEIALVIILIPHAGDVYVDTMFGAHLANIGVEGIINGIIDDMLGEIVIGMMEKVILLDVVDTQANLVASSPSYSLIPEKKHYKKLSLSQYVQAHSLK